MNNAKRAEIFERLREHDPNPTTELHYESAFELLVAVILSAQATDVSVNKATAKLYAEARTPQAILDLGEAGLKRYVKSIGLYNAKAKNIIKTCRILLQQHSGEVPRELESTDRPGCRRQGLLRLDLASELFFRLRSRPGS